MTSGHEEGFRGGQLRGRHRHLPGDQERVAARPLRDQSLPDLHPPSRKNFRLQDRCIIGYQVR